MQYTLQCSLHIISRILAVVRVLYCGHNRYLLQVHRGSILQSSTAGTRSNSGGRGRYWQCPGGLYCGHHQVFSPQPSYYCEYFFQYKIISSMLQVPSLRMKYTASIICTILKHVVLVRDSSSIVRVCAPGTAQRLSVRQYGSACFAPPRKRPSQEFIFIFICDTSFGLLQLCILQRSAILAVNAVQVFNISFRDSYTFPA